MGHVFLSYSRRDQAAVDTLARRLERHGIEIWVDRRGISGGEQWRREIVDAIRTASVFVLFVSPSSVRSDNVRKELDLAEGARLRILPVILGPAEIPSSMMYQLAGIQFIELWRDEAQGTGQLLRALGASATGRQPAGAAASGRVSAADAAAYEARQPKHNLSDLGGARFLDLVSLGNLGRLFRRKPR